MINVIKTGAGGSGGRFANCLGFSSFICYTTERIGLKVELHTMDEIGITSSCEV